MPDAALTPFEQHWMAETLRRHEAEHGALDDAALLPELARVNTSEARILRRAERLIRTLHPHWLADMRAWQAQTRWIILLLGLLAALGGFFSALSLFNTGMPTADGRVLNVVWLLLALLFLPVLSLCAWLVFLFLPGSGGQTLLGQLGLWLQRHLPGQSVERLHIGQALLSLLIHHRLLRWGMGALSHGLWLIALGAALLGILLMLATQRHVFIWETTILPGAVFVEFVRLIGQLPALLGFTIPGTEMVLASGTPGNQPEMLRHAWASWLIGGVLAYGILPRLAALALSLGLWKHGLATLQLDLQHPGYALLRARLHQNTQALGVIDPAPALLPTSTHQHRAAAPALTGEASTLVGFELGADLTWPPVTAGRFRVYPRIDSREERQHLLDSLSSTSPNILLIAVDSRLSPDRGSLLFINQLAQHSATPLVWLMSDNERSPLWRSSLREAGWPNDALLDDAAARAWLEVAQ